MRLKFIKAEDTAHKAKATVHQTGKLGFSSDANEFLKLSEDLYIQFAINDEDIDDPNLYAVLTKDEDGAYKISKAGSYYYVAAKSLFDNLNIDYTRTRIIYDLVKTEYEGQEIIKMIRREIKKKKKLTPTNE